MSESENRDENRPRKKKDRKYCSVPGCKATEVTKSMFRFPSNAARREAWKVACKISGPLKKNVFVCERHFPDYSLVRTAQTLRVKSGADPTLNIPEDTQSLTEKGPHCAVEGCKKTPKDEGITLHHFPHRDPSKQKQWKSLCLVAEVTKKTVICSEHFEEKDFRIRNGTRSLGKGATPSRNLPLRGPLQPRMLVQQQALDQDDSGGCSHSERSSSEAGNQTAEQDALELAAAVQSIGGDTANFSLEDHCPCDAPSNSRQDMADFAVRELESLQGVGDSAGSRQSAEKGLLAPEMVACAKAFINDHSYYALEESTETTQNNHSSQSSQTTPVVTSDKSTQTDFTLRDEAAAACERKTLLTLLQTDVHLKAFCNIDFKTLDFLCGVVGLVQREVGGKSGGMMSLKEKIVLTLCKLKLNLTFRTLGVMFGTDRATCSRQFRDTVALLALTLKPLIPWPTREEVNMNLPLCFKDFGKTRVVLDCTEVSVDKPRCLKCRLRMYSHYKGGQTVKFLIGCAPSGLITFVSDAYGGRASDKHIFEESDLITKKMLEPVMDAVMVDKGFRIDEICEAHSIGLIRPPFVRANNPLNKAEGELNAKIASARVHVERAIQRIKLFRIMQGKLSWCTVLDINYIMIVIAALVNLSPPILSNERF